MGEQSLINAGFEQITKDLGLEEVALQDSEHWSYERLHDWLRIMVSHLIDKDFNGLINRLYRMDVPEDLVKKILSSTAPEKVADELAHAIIQRAFKKIETRRKYS